MMAMDFISAPFPVVVINIYRQSLVPPSSAPDFRPEELTEFMESIEPEESRQAQHGRIRYATLPGQMANRAEGGIRWVLKRKAQDRPGLARQIDMPKGDPLAHFLQVFWLFVFLHHATSSDREG
jgi:hypothetical protein